MTRTPHLPLSGFAILEMYSTTAELRPKAPLSEVADSSERPVSFGWNWRFLSDDEFEVRLTVLTEPTKAHPYQASVDAVGRFKRSEDVAVLAVEDFAKLQAVAIVMPYLRQFLSSLTANARGGAIYLPSINVASLMKAFEPSKTLGARQLADDVPRATIEASTTGSTSVATRRRPKTRNLSLKK